MSEEKKIKRTYGDCEVTITFKGYNPNVKETVMNMLCDSFEDRVMNTPEPTEKAPEKPPVKTETVHLPVSGKRKRGHAR